MRRPQAQCLLQEPALVRDGQTIYFEQRLTSDCNPYYLVDATDFDILTYCNYSRVQPIINGKVQPWLTPSYKCFHASPLAVHPQRDVLMMTRADCVSGRSGFWEWTLNAGADPSERQLTTPHVGLPGLADAAWLPDGASLVVIAGQTKKTIVNPEGPERPHRMGVQVWKELTGYQLLYEPQDDATDILGLAISAAGDAVVEVSRTVGDRENTQLYLFDLKAGKLGDQLTQDEENGAPAW